MHPALELQAARLRLDRASGSDLVAAAVSALRDGVESTSLVLLAGEHDPILSDAAPLFLRALVELGLDVPGKDSSEWTLIRFYLQRIADGLVKPSLGIERLRDDVSAAFFSGRDRVYAGDAYDLQSLVGLFYAQDELLDRPDEVSLDGKYGAEALEALEAALREGAMEWLERHPV